MIKEKLKLMPTKPGCYLMKDNNNAVIYVGKAKKLKNRVSTYFTGTHTGKTLMLVNNITDFEYIVTNNEPESLLLELNLIKKYNPKYNVLLKDDKSYPYIEITNEKVPRLNIVRNVKKKQAKLFGPYPNVTAARETVNLLNRVYPLRKCKTYPKTPCLYYHIDQCLGYCVSDVSKIETNKMISDITKFLNGDHLILTKKIKQDISYSSEKLQYERCLELKEMLNYIEIVLNRQKIDINDLVNRDIFGYHTKNGYISIQVFFLRRGSLVERKSDIFPIVEDEAEELTRYISLFYEKNLKPKEVLVPANIDSDLLEEVLNITFITPLKGIKKQLLEMANNNAKLSLENEFELITRNETKIEEALDQLKQLLNIDKVDRIEIFDNSHLFGEFSVSGMVVFENGQPNKKEYRKYKITSDVKDDYHLMQEVIYRRYFKVIKEKLPIADLIVVDGGIAQVNATKEILESLNLNIKVVGLKKDDSHRTNKLIADKEIDIKKTSQVFFLLTRMQDEVHRYTINYHRNIRSKGSLESVLDNVKGIGKERKTKLLRQYGSITKLKELSKEELNETLPMSVVSNLYEYLHEELPKNQ